jgi:NAD(P)-dependent dehydrogenase (short-subunit alcohol dehydrogenase family)
MNLDLSGRTALVTGSTVGIGRAVAKALAEMGAAVAVHGRSAERVAAAIAGLKSEAGSAKFIAAPGDITTDAGIAGILDVLPAVDILVNNAGIFSPKHFFEIADEEWRHFFDVNVLGGVRLARSYVPGMMQRGFGRVVFVSSESALQIPPEMVHYGMTKTAVLAVARGLAETVAGSGVTVNSVLPGPTATEGVVAFLKKMAPAGDAADLDEVGRRFILANRPTSLVGRLIAPEEVASMIAYLCSPAASATTGAALRVDGGVVRSII